MRHEQVDEVFRGILSGIAPPPEISPERAALRTILHAYDKAMAFENTTIPTALMCAIESARKV